MPRNQRNKPQHSDSTGSTDAIWMRKKLRNREPFCLTELTPSGVPLYVALGWADDEKGDGYKAAKARVSKVVPASDWKAGEFPEKSSENLHRKGSQPVGRPKEQVYLTANGVKHLLAHVPARALAEAWVQYLANAEEKLALVRDASSRHSVRSEHRNAHSALLGAGLDAAGSSASQATAFSALRGEARKTVVSRIKGEKGLAGKDTSINIHDHATSKSNAQQAVLLANLALGAEYAEPGTPPQAIGFEAAKRTINSINSVSRGADVKVRQVKGRDGRVKNKHYVPFEMANEGPAMSTKRVDRVLNRDQQDQQEERRLLAAAAEDAAKEGGAA